MQKVKKMTKNDPPLKKAKMSLKWPKSTLCEIRAAWSGVFWVPGGTTGPGFKAEIRPPLFLHFFTTFFIFFTFVICVFCVFLCFWLSDKLYISCELPFFTLARAIIIRPYSNYTGEESDVCVVVLPSSWWRWSSRYVWWGNFMSGRIHRRGDLDLYSRSPLSEPVMFYLVCFWRLQCRGDYTG